MLSLVFLSLTIFSFASSKRMYGCFVSPFSIFTCIFSIGFFLLFGTSFINYGLISEKLSIIYCLSFIFFTLGSLFSFICKRNYRAQTSLKRKNDLSKKAYRRFIAFLFAIVLISTILYWISCIKTFGINNFFLNLLETKEIDNINGLPTIVLYLKMISVFLSPFTVFYMIKYRDYSLKIILVLIFTFLANIAYTRMSIFYIIALDFFAILYGQNDKIKQPFVKKLLAFAFGIVLIFAALFIFSFTQQLFDKTFEIHGSIFGIKINDSIATIISYLSGPLVSSSLYLEETLTIPFLGYTLRSLKSVFNLFGFGFDTSSYFPEMWVYIPFKFNTASLQFYIYGEGGYLWTCLFFLLLGASSSTIFLSFKKNRDVFSLMLLSFVSILLLFSVRSYLLTRLDMFIYLLMLLCTYLFKKVSLLS